VTVTAITCFETSYTPDRKLLPAYPTPTNSLIKYILAVDGTQTYNFAFDYLPNSCNFWKEYVLSVKTYPGNVDVASFPWITVNENQGVATLTVNSVDAAVEGYYTVKIYSKLYAASSNPAEFSFKIYLSVTPCLYSVLSWGASVP
jgi:hypothetical protein